jgi:hypothetical protein
VENDVEYGKHESHGSSSEDQERPMRKSDGLLCFH